MDKVRFKNGVEYDCGFIGQPNANMLYVTLANVSYVEAAIAFSSPENIEEITFIPTDGSEIVFRNFTMLDFIVNQGNSMRACLRIPFITEV